MTDVPLREHFEAQLKSLEDRIKVQRDADRQALKLQAREYERRLNNLNDEHGRVDKIVNTKVDRVEWDDYHRRTLAADYIPRIEFAQFQQEVVTVRATAMGEARVRSQLVAFAYSGVGVIASLVAGYFLRK